MRFRRGAQDVAFRDDAVGGNAVGNIMVDHCSASWGLDENMSIYRHVYNRGADGHGLKLPTVNITIRILFSLKHWIPTIMLSVQPSVDITVCSAVISLLPTSAGIVR